MGTAKKQMSTASSVFLMFTPGQRRSVALSEPKVIGERRELAELPALSRLATCISSPAAAIVATERHEFCVPTVLQRTQSGATRPMATEPGAVRLIPCAANKLITLGEHTDTLPSRPIPNGAIPWPNPQAEGRSTPFERKPTRASLLEWVSICVTDWLPRQMVITWRRRHTPLQLS